MASARTGELLLGWDGRNKKSPAQGLGIVKGSLAQAGHLKCSFAAQKGSARSFRGETKEEFKDSRKKLETLQHKLSRIWVWIVQVQEIKAAATRRGEPETARR